MVSNQETAPLLGTATDSTKLYSKGISVKHGEGSEKGQANETSEKPVKGKWQEFKKLHLQPPTVAGACIFVLYHVMYCLANGSNIIRPHSLDRPILGVTVKLSALGVMFASPLYILRLGKEIPACYPSADLFMAPFMAHAAAKIDDHLFLKYGGEYPDEEFFATFCVLSGIGMFFCGCFLQLAATFKLANIGVYLPYSVLCGFFSAVGVLLWALAFSVDTTGKTWQMVFFSGDWELILNSLMHHAPSVVVGILMKIWGPKNPFYVLLLILATLVSFYSAMWITGTSLEEAQQAEWFWSREELVFDQEQTALEFWSQPPAPFCNVWSLFSHATDWQAVWNGLPDMAALAFLYLLRSSIHASALKKNVSNLVRLVPNDPIIKDTLQEDASNPGDVGRQESKRVRRSEVEPRNRPSRPRAKKSVVQRSIEIKNRVKRNSSLLMTNLNMATKKNPNRRMSSGIGFVPVDHTVIKPPPEINFVDFHEKRPPAPEISLEQIFAEYGYSLFAAAAGGGFACCPTVATSNTMYSIGADGPAPQFGAALLLLVFYLTDFEVVKFIPKTVFSSLLFLGAVDTLVAWFYAPFKKSQSLAEWIVVPTIVVFSILIGFLNAVFLGIAFAMFIFVGSFFQVGVVKFSATALEIRSRIERSAPDSLWLDENGDLIHVLVIQNFLFFGNASKIYTYIKGMFDKTDEAESLRSSFMLPSVPKIVVLDFSLISGMDSSTLDIFAEIVQLSKVEGCKLYLSGLSNRFRKGFEVVGIKEEPGPSSDRKIRFLPDLDTALGKAENFLLDNHRNPRRATQVLSAVGEDGFRRALQQLDDQHGLIFLDDLFALQEYVTPLELEQGQRLYGCDGGVVKDYERGLFFIESGELKVERDNSNASKLTRMRNDKAFNANEVLALKHKNARVGTLSKRGSAAYFEKEDRRVMRFGPGWVCGTLEYASGHKSEGVTSAVTDCVLHHLPFSTLARLEKENPALVLSLYKTLQYLMARREEIAIDHLNTLETIMNSRAHSEPLDKVALKKMSVGLEKNPV